jgi:hypothetical protein
MTIHSVSNTILIYRRILLGRGIEIRHLTYTRISDPQTLILVIEIGGRGMVDRSIIPNSARFGLPSESDL